MKLRVKGDPTKKDVPISPFSNWAGTTDRAVMAKKLGDLGMTGADQIYNDNPDPTDPNSIKHSQGDWKLAAVQKILEKAHDKGIRDPTTAMANKSYLLSGLDKPYQDAVNSDTFNNIHPNFWQVITQKLLPLQWAKNDAAANQNQVVTK
jgi:hypothetical protein